MHALIVSPSPNSSHLYFLNNAAHELVSDCENGGKNPTFLEGELSAEILRESLADSHKILVYYGPLANDLLLESEEDSYLDLRNIALNNKIEGKIVYVASTNGMDLNTLGNMYIGRGAKAFIGFKDEFAFFSSQAQMDFICGNKHATNMIIKLFNHVMINICGNNADAQDAVKHVRNYCAEIVDLKALIQPNQIAPFCMMKFAFQFMTNIGGFYLND